VYLLHPIIIIALYAYFLHPAHMTMTKMIAYLCVVVPTAYLFSLGLYVGVERPIRRLARFYTDRRRSLTPAQEMA
jgi:peptidoglycan/LPS O-acetylase OafA/YrhL